MRTGSCLMSQGRRSSGYCLGLCSTGRNGCRDAALLRLGCRDHRHSRQDLGVRADLLYLLPRYTIQGVEYSPAPLRPNGFENPEDPAGGLAHSGVRVGQSLFETSFQNLHTAGSFHCVLRPCTVNVHVCLNMSNDIRSHLDRFVLQGVP